jgi:hypothetical protein
MKISYETHYRSAREDGRHTATMAAFLERLRNTKPELSMPEDLDAQKFEKWKNQLRSKVHELLKLDLFAEEAKSQPAPKLLYTVQRDGYRVEKWEFYPDAYSAVPMLALIPDGASAQEPVPAVMCFPGSTFSKELLAGEPLLDMAACRMDKFADRNRMAWHIVKCGIAAFAFDNPATAECALEIEREGDFGAVARSQMCHGLIQNGLSYFGLSVSQKLVALDFIKTLPYVDTKRLGVSGHSLGCDDAMYVALLREEISAVVFNDLVCDERHRYFSTTEYDERQMCNNVGNWHEIPGSHATYSRPDVLAALAPRHLALNEGGAQYFLDQIRRAYALFGADDNLQVTHYPKYAEKESRSTQYEPPAYGFSADTYFEYTNTDAPDHSYRAEPSVALLKKAFKL